MRLMDYGEFKWKILLMATLFTGLEHCEGPLLQEKWVTAWFVECGYYLKSLESLNTVS